MGELGLCITGFCEIYNGALHVNGGKVLSSDNPNLEETLALVVSKSNVVHPRFGKMDRLAQLGYTCVEVLLQGKNIKEKYKPEDVCLLLSNSSSSLDNDLKYNATLETFPSPSLFVYTLPNIMLAEICIKNGFKGENLFFISDTFDVTLMHNQIEIIFNNNRANACICGWIEVFKDSYRGFVFLVERESENGIININVTNENISALFNK